MAQSGSDSWLKEFEEAMRLADDILARLNERNMMLTSGADPSRLVSATRRKLTMLGTKLDRLESLLKNPPMKTNITEKEMYRRQDMLLGIRFRTKQMTSALSTDQPSNRANLLSNGSRSNPPVETSKTQGLDNYGVINLQKQVMKDQDEDLAGLEATVTSTKHIALAVNEELDLHNHLLDDMDKEADDTNNRLKAAHRKLGVLNKNSNRSCSLMCMCFMLLAIVLLIVIALSLVKSL